jgi:hypothetical protein
MNIYMYVYIHIYIHIYTYIFIYSSITGNKEDFTKNSKKTKNEIIQLRAQYVPTADKIPTSEKEVPIDSDIGISEKGESLEGTLGGSLGRKSVGVYTPWVPTTGEKIPGKDIHIHRNICIYIYGYVYT